MSKQRFGWLSRLLGRASGFPTKEVVGLIQEIVRNSGNQRGRFRQLMIDAVKAGDFDRAFDVFRAANDRAKDFVQKG